MSVNVAIGVQDFSTLIENHYFYVDKTAFLKEWWDSGDSVTLIMRTRRFGKSIDNEHDGAALFNGICRTLWSV